MTGPVSDHVLVERPATHPGLLVIRLNRPDKKNAITQAMYRRMTEALAEAAADPAIGAVAFLGTPGCFSAGNDMADFLAVATGGLKGELATIAFLRALASAPKPMVSGVDGLAIGIGTTLHLHCDLTIASPRSLFRTPFTDLGLVPEAGSSLLLPRLVGHQAAFALLAAGEGMSGEDARQAGLIWKVAPEEAVETETLSLGVKLAAKPPEAMRISRDLLRGNRAAVAERIEEELRHFSERLKSAEARAAFEAFLARR